MALSTAALPLGLEFGLGCFFFLLNLDPKTEEQEFLDVTAKDDQGYTILHVACEYDLLKATEKLLSLPTGGELLESKDRLQDRPIHRCAAKNSVASGDCIHFRHYDQIITPFPRKHVNSSIAAVKESRHHIHKYPWIHPTPCRCIVGIRRRVGAVGEGRQRPR